jgi:rhamnose utilization protein RhaD (predicted bifunctional aldolase and dehydrogenase)/NAD(P)-dependent dehydrogenase (short-subunit alcohol dehydrogenase family)
MKNAWNVEQFNECIAAYGAQWGDDLASCVYVTRLVGRESALALHGGGNTSVKAALKDFLGESHEALYVKASGCDMAQIEPQNFVALDQAFMLRFGALESFTDHQMAAEFATHQLRWTRARPSIEALLHALIPAKYVLHTHAEAVLALTNRIDARAVLEAALGSEVRVVNYARAGADLSKAIARSLAAADGAKALVLMGHGLVTWGATAQEAYAATVAIVSLAENYLHERQSALWAERSVTPVDTARARFARIAPLLRGALTPPSGDADRPYRRMILQLITTPDILALLDWDGGRALLDTPPLTPDYLIRTKALPLWLAPAAFDDPDRFSAQLGEALAAYKTAYADYLENNRERVADAPACVDCLPRVVLIPGVGAVACAASAADAQIVADITVQAIAVKARIARSGGSYLGLSDDHLFEMEYHLLQQAKLEAPQNTGVAIVTGGAGAIGHGICDKLLTEGWHVALSDLPGSNLESTAAAFEQGHPGRILAVAMDVTDPASVAAGYASIIMQWGGVDLLIANAGIAAVAPLTELSIETFRKLERVNIEGTLLTIAEAGRLFKLQKTGGDIVLISTKNVFAPGAKFGAYSATKAAAHQLARIASLELADIDVRVNMVAPDAVFAHGQTKSGLWAEVGPDRMKARGLDEKGLQDYYQSRNLLKTQVTAEHVGRAVMYFATRQTPTTGATLPVDGGLPDATPR